MKPRSFFFHYNKPASKSAKRPKISLHWRGKCVILDNVVCGVPTSGKIRKTQPMFVMCGKATELTIDENNIGFLK